MLVSLSLRTLLTMHGHRNLTQCPCNDQLPITDQLKVTLYNRTCVPVDCDCRYTAVICKDVVHLEAGRCGLLRLVMCHLALLCLGHSFINILLIFHLPNIELSHT